MCKHSRRHREFMGAGSMLICSDCEALIISVKITYKIVSNSSEPKKLAETDNPKEAIDMMLLHKQHLPDATIEKIEIVIAD